MKSKKWFLFFCVMVTIVSSVQGQYFGSPANNLWNYSYDARFDGRPDQDSPAWSRGVYTTTDPSAVNYSGVTNDVLTGEKTLFMRQPNNASPYYNATSPFIMTGTTNDQFTMDFRFRVADASQPDSTVQLVFYVDRPRPDGLAGRQSFNIHFRKDGIQYADNGVTKYSQTVPLGTDWHTARWQLDVKNGQASFYLDDSTTARFTCARTLMTDATVNRIIWGDLAGANTGEAFVSYIRISTNELVAPKATNAVVAHTGMLTPTTSGFTQIKAGAVSVQGGVENSVEYWEIDDNDAAGYGVYRKQLGESEVGHHSGWTATVRLRVVDIPDGSYQTVMHVCDGKNEWMLRLSKNGVYYQRQDTTLVKLADVDTTTEYCTYQIVYEPFADSGMGRADYFVNGQQIGSVIRSEIYNDTQIRRFDFGSILSALTDTVRYAGVSFEVGKNVYVPSGTVIILR